MSERLFARMLAPLARRISAMLARGAVVLVDATGQVQRVQLRLLADETKDALEHAEPYGFTSNPLPGAEAVAAFFDGDRGHGVALVVGDRRYRLRGLAAGEVAMYDDQGQTVVITRTGIVIHTGMLARIEAADIELHASHSYSWDVNGYGERWTHVSGSTWEHRTWQTGATVTPVSGAINPPEGP